MLTASEHIDLMTHALGKTPDARHNLWATFNRAGRAMVTRHDWTWRMRGPVSIPVVASQSWLAMPDDFAGETESFVPNTGNFTLLEKTSLRRIVELRSQNRSNQITGTMYIYFPAWATQVSREDPPTQRAELYPTPTTAGQPTISLIYKGRWREITENDNNAIPNIPPDFEQALILTARSYAICIENQMPPYEDGPAAVEIDRLIKEDSQRQSEMGRMTGGVDRRYAREFFANRFPRRATL